MRALAALATVMLFGPAVAQTPTVPQGSKYVIAGSAVPEVPVAAWEVSTPQGPKWHAVAGAAAVKKAPANAVRYTTKSVAWPTGIVRVLSFRKGDGGVLHEITRETEIFVLKGSAQATVGGKIVTLKAGDVASHPTGVLRSVGAGEDTVIVTWDVASLDGNATPAVVRSDQANTTRSDQWMQDGKVMRAATEAEARNEPADAVRLTVTRYDFPGNSIRVAHMAAAVHPTAPASAKTDSLIYLTSGHVRFHEGDEVHEARAGDFIREDASQSHVWDHLEESSFVTTSALPVGSGPAKPAEATDLPKSR